MKPEKEDYRRFLEREWADIHHSRVQEWTALGVVAGSHLGLVQLFSIEKDAPLVVDKSLLIIFASVIAALFTVLGILMTCRHRHLMRVKLGWIYKAEEFLGLVKKHDNPEGIIDENIQMKQPIKWNGLSLPRPLSTSGIIIFFYMVLFMADIFILSSYV